jgi:hypothetical protein
LPSLAIVRSNVWSPLSIHHTDPASMTGSQPKDWSAWPQGVAQEVDGRSPEHRHDRDRGFAHGGQQRGARVRAGEPGGALLTRGPPSSAGHKLAAYHLDTSRLYVPRRCYPTHLIRDRACDDRESSSSGTEEPSFGSVTGP